MVTMNSRRLSASEREFQETRPTLYFAEHHWTHLNAARRLRRWAANDNGASPIDGHDDAAAPPFVDLTTAAWVDDAPDAVVAPAPATSLLPSRSPPSMPLRPAPRSVDDAREPRLLLAWLAGGVALAVSALGAASHLLGG